MTPSHETMPRASWLTEDPPEDTYHDLLCTGLIDVSRFGDKETKMEPCNGGEYILQGTDAGAFKVICVKCRNEYELPAAIWRVKPEGKTIEDDFHLDAFHPSIADGDDSE